MSGVFKSSENYAYGLYQGIVDSIDDPENRGRIRVRILGFSTPSQTDDDLFWCETCSPMSSEDITSFTTIPPIGSYVYVSFINGDIGRPVIVGYGRKPHSISTVNYSKYYNMSKGNLMYLKTGLGDGSPRIYVDGVSQAIDIQTRSSRLTFNDILNIVIDNNLAGMFIDKNNLSMFFKSLFTSYNSLSFSNQGVSIETSNNYIERCSKKITLIGKEYCPNVTSTMNYILSILGGNSKTEEDKIYNKSSLQDIIGNDAYNFLSDLSVSEMYNNILTVRENAIQIDRNKLTNILKKMNINQKKVFVNILNSIPPISLKDFLVTFPKEFEKIKKIRKESEMSTDFQKISGNQNINIMGEQNITAKSKKLSIFENYYITMTFGDYKIDVIKGNINTFLGKGNYKINLAAGKFQIGFLNPKSSVEISSMASKLFPLLKRDSLVKKKAIDDLYSIVSSIVSYIRSHFHIASAPGAPTTPPTIPIDAFPLYTKAFVQWNIFKSFPSPVNVYFTNNLKST